MFAKETLEFGGVNCIQITEPIGLIGDPTSQGPFPCRAVTRFPFQLGSWIRVTLTSVCILCRVCMEVMGQVLLRSIVSPLSELDCIWEVCNIHMLRCRLSLPYCVNCKVWYHQQYARSRLLSVRSKLYLSKKQSFVRFNWLHYSLRPSRYNITNIRIKNMSNCFNITIGNRKQLDSKYS